MTRMIYSPRRQKIWAMPRWVLGRGRPVIHLLRAVPFVLMIPFALLTMVGFLLVLPLLGRNDRRRGRRD